MVVEVGVEVGVVVVVVVVVVVSVVCGGGVRGVGGDGQRGNGYGDW